MKRPDKVELAVGIAATLAFLCVVALLWWGEPAPVEQGMTDAEFTEAVEGIALFEAVRCMQHNGWADVACDRFLPGSVWP